MSYIGKLAKGSLVASDGSSQRELPVGSDGEILLADSTETLGLKWATNPGGGADFELISSATASTSASISFTGLSSTYFSYRVVIEDFIPVSDPAFLWMRTSTNNGSSYDSGASDYYYTGNQAFPASSPSDYGSFGDSKLLFASFGVGSNTNENSNYVIDIINPSNTRFCTAIWECMYISGAGNPAKSVGMGYRATAADVDAIQFLCSTGNIETGNFRLYGVRA